MPKGSKRRKGKCDSVLLTLGNVHGDPASLHSVHRQLQQQVRLAISRGSICQRNATNSQ